MFQDDTHHTHSENVIKINVRLHNKRVVCLSKTSLYIIHINTASPAPPAYPPRVETQRNELIKHFHSTEKSDGKLARR